MTRFARLSAGAIGLLVAATVLCAGPAFAAPAGGTAATIAGHGLGARSPVSRLAPHVAPSVAVALPVSVDPRKWAVTPGNQGSLNSCVPWAIDYAMLGWYSRSSGLAGQPFAPMYTYSQINGGGDYGSSATAALQVAVTQGSDTRAHYSQGDGNWSTPPTAAERANAARFEIKGYTTLFAGYGQAATTALLKQSLATNHPVAIEMAVRHGFDYLATSSSAVDNDTTSAIRGDHEVLAVGYDAAGLVVQNSWGTGWANGGFGRISWKVVQTDVGEGETIDGFVQAVTGPTTSVPSTTRVSAKATTPTTKYQISWKGIVGNSGAITRYEAWYQVDGHAFVSVRLTSARAAGFVLTAQNGHRYKVMVRATATAKLGPVRYGATFTA